jgi:hypothetical protein
MWWPVWFSVAALLGVTRALLTKFPELRDAFAGMVVRAVEPSGKDYGSMMPMKDIK